MNPFCAFGMVHEDHFRHQVARQKNKKKQPDPYIASQRLCFRQIRAFASDPSIQHPEDMTLWNGMRVGDYVARIMLHNYVD